LKSVNADEQTSLIFDFMQAIAPQVAHHHLRVLEKRSSGGPFVPDEEQLKDLRRQSALNSANITLEFAMHLAAAFARCQAASIDETKPAQTQEPTAADKPRKTKPTARIHPPAPGVSARTPPVPDLPEHRD
jgi:hypothetical protein